MTAPAVSPAVSPAAEPRALDRRPAEAPPPRSPAPAVVVGSDLLGPVTVPADQLIEFTAGLHGFPECRRFVLVPAARAGLFWLQSAEYGALAFLVVDPFVAFDGFEIDLSPADLLALQVAQPSEVAVLAVVTLPRSRDERPTANLQGPIVFNMARRCARQVVLSPSGGEDDGWRLRAPLDIARLP